VGTRYGLGVVTLAEDLYLLADDPATGRPLIDVTHLDLGLGGALLLDLAVRERVALLDEHVTLTGEGTTGEPLLDAALATIAERTRAYGPDHWVRHLGRGKPGPGQGGGRKAGRGHPAITAVTLAPPWWHVPAGLRWRAAPGPPAARPSHHAIAGTGPGRPVGGRGQQGISAPSVFLQFFLRFIFILDIRTARGNRPGCSRGRCPSCAAGASAPPTYPP